MEKELKFTKDDNHVNKIMQSTMNVETKIIQGLLPDHYKCEPRENGVHCQSDIGINEVTEEHFFKAFVFAVEQIFGDRFIELFHQTCTNHVKFTVYIRP